VLSFFDWGYDHGDDMAHELNYVPMPDSVVKLVRSAWQQQIHGPDDAPVWGAAK
jgi:phosphate transport system substrate-binding protein